MYLTDGKIKIGAFTISDKKRPAICIQEENKITVCGYFQDAKNAEIFMDALAEMIKAEKDEN